MTRDPNERLFFNALSIEQAGQQLRRGWQPVLLRTSDLTTGEACYLLMRDPGSEQEFVVLRGGAKMERVTMTMGQVCRWMADHYTAGTIRLPILRNEYVEGTESDAAQRFEAPAEVRLVSLPPPEVGA